MKDGKIRGTRKKPESGGTRKGHSGERDKNGHVAGIKKHKISPHGKKRKADDSRWNSDNGVPNIGRSAAAREKAKKRREARRPSSEPLVATLMNLWERLRSPALEEDVGARRALVAQIIEHISGRNSSKRKSEDESNEDWLKMSKSHRASRVVQAIFKHGSLDQKKLARKALQPYFVDLAQEQYGHFVVVRALDHMKGADRAPIVESVATKMKTLSKTAHGSTVVSSAYSYATSAQRQAMIAEFFVDVSSSVTIGDKTIQTSKGAYSSVEDLLNSEPHRKAELIVTATKAIRPALEKSLLDPPLIHHVILNIIKAGGHAVLADIRENLCGPSLLRIVHTREGSRVACILIAMATAKERKAIVKAVKSQVQLIMRDDYGHLVLTSLLMNVDDTILTKKLILAEILKQDIYETLTHKSARVPILAIVSPSGKRYLTPDKKAILTIEETFLNIVNRSDTEGNNIIGSATEKEKANENQDINQNTVTVQKGLTSKKDALKRRIELLGSGDSSLAHQIVGVCEERLDDLLLSQYGNDLVFEVARGGEDGLLAEAVGKERIRGLQSAIIGFITSSEVLEDREFALEEYYCSRMLKRLLITGGGKGKDADIAREFGSMLWAKIIKGRCLDYIATHAAKVIAACLCCGHEESVSALMIELKESLRKEQTIEEWASGLGVKL